MKEHNTAKIISVFLCAAVMLGTIIFTRTELHGAVSNPLLYYNDSVWDKEARYPIEKVISLYYIPASLFDKFENVNTYTNDRMKNFYIYHGDLFISFDLDSDFALVMDSAQERTRMYIKTYQLHSDRYIPAQEVCKHLNLGYETLTSPVTGEVAIRITDGNQKYSFEQLVREKYPGFFAYSTTTETTLPTDTSPPDTTLPVQTTEVEQKIGERSIYLTIEDSPGEYTGEILDALSEFGYKATFFIIGDAAAANPELISRIAAKGHAIGLHTMSHDSSKLTDADSILSDIEAENEILYRIIRRKVHIWRAPEGSAALLSMNPITELALNQSGYIIWDYNIDLSKYGSISKAAESAIEGIWDFDNPVIRLCEDENTAAILREILTFIYENSQNCEVRTISPAYYEINNVIK